MREATARLCGCGRAKRARAIAGWRTRWSVRGRGGAIECKRAWTDGRLRGSRCVAALPRFLYLAAWPLCAPVRRWGLLALLADAGHDTPSRALDATVWQQMLRRVHRVERASWGCRPVKTGGRSVCWQQRRQGALRCGIVVRPRRTVRRLVCVRQRQRRGCRQAGTPRELGWMVVNSTVKPRASMAHLPYDAMENLAPCIGAGGTGAADV